MRFLSTRSSGSTLITITRFLFFIKLIGKKNLSHTFPSMFADWTLTTPGKCMSSFWMWSTVQFAMVKSQKKLETKISDPSDWLADTLLMSTRWLAKTLTMLAKVPTSSSASIANSKILSPLGRSRVSCFVRYRAFTILPCSPAILVTTRSSYFKHVEARVPSRGLNMLFLLFHTFTLSYSYLCFKYNFQKQERIRIRLQPKKTWIKCE